MEKSLQNILKVAFAISTIGLIMDSDVKEASMLFRFFEFFMMTATIFSLLAAIYYSFNFLKQNFQKTQKA